MTTADAAEYLRVIALEVDTTREASDAIWAVLGALESGRAADQLEHVRALAFSARWADTVGTGHLLAARILNVLDGGR